MHKFGLSTVDIKEWNLHCNRQFLLPSTLTDEEKSKDVHFFSKVAAAAASKVKTKRTSDPNTIPCSNWKNLLILKDIDGRCDNSQIIHNKQ